jgi:sarcosine oxidase gamma subunit
MAAAKGTLPPNAGKGRVAGVPNKTTALLKDAILRAAEAAGNKVGQEGMVSYLTQQAEQNPAAFLSLLGKVLPMQVEGTGKDGAIEVRWLAPS